MKKKKKTCIVDLFIKKSQSPTINFKQKYKIFNLFLLIDFKVNLKIQILKASRETESYVLHIWRS